jgi:hypothetical protein
LLYFWSRHQGRLRDAYCLRCHGKLCRVDYREARAYRYTIAVPVFKP